jgi:hypothetical protein
MPRPNPRLILAASASASTASRRSSAVLGYPGLDVWVPLDPDKLAESEEIWRTAKAGLTAWYAAESLVSQEDRKAARMAKKATVDP